MGQERLDSLSLLCIESDILRSVDFEDVIKDFALAKSRKRTFLNCVLHCNCNCMQQGCKRDLSLWISKQYRRPAFSTMYVQFCNEAKSCAYWLVNETLWYETKTRPRHLIFSPRQDRDRDLPTFPRDRDETETFGNCVSRPRRRDRDYIPAQWSTLCGRTGNRGSCWPCITDSSSITTSVQMNTPPTFH